MPKIKSVKKLETRYWLSFDLGLRGDYQPLYAWLDQQEAKECGEGVATFCSNMSRDEIADKLSELFDDEKNARVYIITKALGGRFILGKRKSPPWKGYGEVESDTGDEN